MHVSCTYIDLSLITIINFKHKDENFATDFPGKFKQSINLKKTGISGIFAASLDLTKEGLIEIMQKKSFDK